MPSFWKHLWQKWNDWVGDRDMELAIRKHLSDNGYFGRTAKLRNVRLIAIKRPGWIQVHRFEATARVNLELPDDDQDDLGPSPEPRYQELLGLVRDDTRENQNTVRIFTDENERKEIFDKWSQDLIRLRGAQGL